MSGRKALATIAASFAAAFALSALACFLPDNPYQRWQLVEPIDYGLWSTLRWAYERIHFDPRPIDVVVVGTSKTLLGVSAARVEEQLAARGIPANVANFSVGATGRNVEWALVDEVFKAKSPKVVVIGVDGEPGVYGHPAFKYVAPAAAVVAPPAPLLHNYFYDLAYLPARQVELFAARFLPSLFGLRETFDPGIYARTRSDFTSGIVPFENTKIDMERQVPRETLLAESTRLYQRETGMERLVRWCCNDGDYQVYLRAMAETARAHGARVIFVLVPYYNYSEGFLDGDFLSQYGVLLDNSFLARDAKLYENRTHLNHAGALANSDRIAEAISELKMSSLDPPSAK